MFLLPVELIHVFMKHRLKVDLEAATEIQRNSHLAMSPKIVTKLRFHVFVKSVPQRPYA